VCGDAATHNTGAYAGVSVYLLDIVPKEGGNRNAIAEGAISKMLKNTPYAFMHPKNARLVTPGNIEDDLEKLSQVDWVIEAVIENPSIKQSLYLIGKRKPQHWQCVRRCRYP